MFYKNHKLYGPYKSKIDGRERVILIFDDKTKKTISYPKYIVECEIGKILDKNETIDHIDGNFLNNNLNNLRIVNRNEHIKQDVIRNKDIIVNCVYCNKEFTIKGSSIRQVNRRNSGTFCSKSCSGKYGSDIRNNKINELYINKIEIDTFKLKDSIKIEPNIGNYISGQQNIGEGLTDNADVNTEA